MEIVNLDLSEKLVHQIMQRLIEFRAKNNLLPEEVLIEAHPHVFLIIDSQIFNPIVHEFFVKKNMLYGVQFKENKTLQRNQILLLCKN